MTTTNDSLSGAAHLTASKCREYSVKLRDLRARIKELEQENRELREEVRRLSLASGNGGD